MEQNQKVTLSQDEIDVIGEIWNISMGSSATALSNILNAKVVITSPSVEMATRERLREIETVPSVGVTISFISGITGSDVLIIHKDDVLKIVARMMGGETTGDEIGELEMSAISEVMNQMIGSAATALSNMLKREVNISPPQAFLIKEDNVEETLDNFKLNETDQVLVKFFFQVEDLLKSELYTILTYDAAEEVVSLMMQDLGGDAQPAAPAPAAVIPPAAPTPAPVPQPAAPPAQPVPQAAYAQPVAQPMPAAQPAAYAPPAPAMEAAAAAYAGVQLAPPPQPKTQVHPARLPNFDAPPAAVPPEFSNFNLIEDVPLDIAVEVGRARRSVKEIIDLSAGSIIELDKQAGDPVDIIVSGQLIARGEVVVIDESFGVRITEIVDKKSV